VKSSTTILLSLIFLASLITPVSAPPTVEKVVFIHYAGTPPQFVLDKWDDTDESYKLYAGGVKWRNIPSGGVPYEINPSGSGFTFTQLHPVFYAATEIWDAEVTPNLFASPTLSKKTIEDLAWDEESLDGVNTIVWGNYTKEGVIAITILWYIPATKTIIEFDMVFDTDYTWSLDALTEAGTQMDIQNIATHEFGHASGLDDLKRPKAWELTMYAWSYYEEVKKRTLGTGDILGIAKLYG